MKKLKILFVFLFVLGFYKINVNAKEYEIDTFEVGQIFKSGDIITLTETGRSKFNSGNYSEMAYRYYVEFFDGDTSLFDDLFYPSWDSYTISSNITSYNSNQDGDTKYWQVTEIKDKEIHYYARLIDRYVSFKLVNREEPSFSLTCDSETINAGESTICYLSSTYLYDINSVNFNILANDFIISNEKGLNNWNVTSNNDNSYLIENENSVALRTNSLNKKILKFSLKTAEDSKTVNIKDNIKLTDITYDDGFDDNHEYNDLSTTINVNEVVKEEKETKNEDSNDETTTNNEEITDNKQEEVKVVENPKTGIEQHQAAILLISVILLISIYIFKRKNFIKNV